MSVKIVTMELNTYMHWIGLLITNQDHFRAIGSWFYRIKPNKLLALNNFPHFQTSHSSIANAVWKRLYISTQEFT